MNEHTAMDVLSKTSGEIYEAFLIIKDTLRKLEQKNTRLMTDLRRMERTASYYKQRYSYSDEERYNGLIDALVEAGCTVEPVIENGKWVRHDVHNKLAEELQAKLEEEC